VQVKGKRKVVIESSPQVDRKNTKKGKKKSKKSKSLKRAKTSQANESDEFACPEVSDIMKKKDNKNYSFVDDRDDFEVKEEDQEARELDD